MYSPERLSGALAVLCLALIVLLGGKPSFTNASRPTRGISDAGIALEVARSLDEVDYILGDAPSPDREVMRIKQYIDFVFLAARTALFLALGLLLMRQGDWGRIAGSSAIVCAVAAGVFGAMEILAILRILDVPLIRTTPAMINAIRSAGAAEWALTAVTLALLSSYFFRGWPLQHFAGGLLLLTAAMELYGLRDNRFLVWQSYPALVGLAAAAVTMFRAKIPYRPKTEG